MEGLVLLWLVAMGIVVAVARRRVEALLLITWIAMGLAALYEVGRLIVSSLT